MRGAARLRPDVVAVVFAGGCLGGATRYWFTTAHPAGTGAFPWSTLVVNLAGAFVLTFVVIIAAELVPSRYLRPLVGTGFCGALTTFSTFSFETLRLIEENAFVHATANVVLSVVGGVVALFGGWAVATALF